MKHYLNEHGVPQFEVKLYQVDQFKNLFDSMPIENLLKQIHFDSMDLISECIKAKKEGTLLAWSNTNNDIENQLVKVLREMLFDFVQQDFIPNEFHLVVKDVLFQCGFAQANESLNYFLNLMGGCNVHLDQMNIHDVLN